MFSMFILCHLHYSDQINFGEGQSDDFRSLKKRRRNYVSVSSLKVALKSFLELTVILQKS